MKKIAVILMIFLAACATYDIPTTCDLLVTVNYPAEFNDGGAVANVVVKATNNQTGREYTASTNENGQASLDIRGGNYSIVVSFSEEHTILVDEYPVLKTILFNGKLSGQVVTQAQTQVSIQTGYSVQSEGFVIKELYVSGSKTPEGKSYGADKFFEIYNNSDKVLYSDGLCFGIVYPNTTFYPTPYVDENGNLLDRIPVWSFVSIVPGSGKEHPIEPGKSFVVALSGLNHRDDPNGNPNSIDLSIAQWELYVEDGKYVDVPSVPNMLMQRITVGSAMVFDQRGTVSILFRLPGNDFQAIFTDQNNYYQAPGSSFNCFMVPKAWVIDGVENAILDDRGVYKRLHDEIDVGYIQHRGSLEKVSIKRKVKEVINGRTVYQDTNNSTEDFLTNQEPTPGVIATN